jgi:hypothetical protein
MAVPPPGLQVLRLLRTLGHAGGDKPMLAHYHNQRGVMYKNLRRWGDAFVNFDAGVKLDPFCPQASTSTAP